MQKVGQYLHLYLLGFPFQLVRTLRNYFIIFFCSGGLLCTAVTFSGVEEPTPVATVWP